MNKIEAFITSIPILKALMREDVMITVFDHEKYVYYSPSSELNFGHKIGDPLPAAYLNYAMVNKGGTTVVKVPEKEFGIPFDSISIPVKDENGEMVGAINAAVSTKKSDTLHAIIETVDIISDNLLNKVQNIAAHSEELSATTTQIAEQTNITVQHSSKIKDIAGTIKSISDQTNLLGLNAAIEAARVGSQGAGFGVVANEIRKLSQDSKQATSNIEETLINITNSLYNMQEDYKEIATSTQVEVQLIMEFITDVEKLKETSNQIKDYIDLYVAH